MRMARRVKHELDDMGEAQRGELQLKQQCPEQR